MVYFDKKGEYKRVTEDHTEFAVGTTKEMLDFFNASSTKEVTTNPMFSSWVKKVGGNKVFFGLPGGTPGEAYVTIVKDSEISIAAFHPSYAEKDGVPFMVIGSSFLHKV